VKGRRNVLILYALATLLTTNHGGVEIIFSPNLVRLGISLPVVGISFALIAGGALASRLPGGTWYRIAHARALITASLAACGLTGAGLSLSGALPVLAGLAAVHGAAYGLASTFMLALLIEETGSVRRTATTMAWYTAGISTGYALGYTLSTRVGDAYGYAAGFLASGAVGLMAAGLALWLTSPRLEQRESAPPPLGIMAGLRAIPSLPLPIWLAALLAFYINFMSDTLAAFFAVYALGIGIALKTIGSIKSVNSLAAAGIRYLAAGVLRNLNVGLVNHASVVGMALGVVGVSLFTNQYLLGAMFGVIGVARGLIRVTSATMIANERERVGPSLGMASALYNGGLDLGGLVAPPVAGGLAALIGLPMTFRLVAVALPLVYYALWLGGRSLGAGRAAQAVPAGEPVPAPNGPDVIGGMER
jgi:MFS family permease